MIGEYDAGYENCIDSMVRQMEDMQFRIDNLRRENAKLRELVLIMHSELVSCEDNGYICGGHKFDKRMRELGIEVEP